MKFVLQISVQRQSATCLTVDSDVDRSLASLFDAFEIWKDLSRKVTRET